MNRRHEHDEQDAELGLEKFARIVLALALQEGLTATDPESFMKMKTVPSSSQAHWDQVTAKFHLNASTGILQLDTFSVPLCLSLPPSFYREAMRSFAQWVDVYQEVHSVRLIDVWHVPVCALFKGRVVDRQEDDMYDAPENSGGKIKHEVYMVGRVTILIVVELNFDYNNPHDHFAYALLELEAAYRLNTAKEIASQSPVYAVLTDMTKFYFLRYDGCNFTLYEKETHVSYHSYPIFLDGMRNVTEILFSIILQGYISTLDAIPVEVRSNLRGGRFGRNDCTRAITLATSAQDALRKGDHTSLEAWEAAGVRGLSLLQTSTSCLSKIGTSTDWSRETLELEFDKVLRGQLK